MSKFSFTSPDGQIFEVLGPPGATEAQARAIFEQQTKSGGLAGLRPGDVISAATQAATGLRSALSQVGIKLPSSIDQSFAQLRNVQLTNPMSAADFVKQAAPNFSLGPLSNADVQGLLSQAAAQTAQLATAVTTDKGIGKFGLDISKLENTGFVKPGTAQSYALAPAPAVSQRDIDEAGKINAEGGDVTPEQVARNRQLTSFLTPSVFTGKNGVASLQTVLSNEAVQNSIQGTVLKQSYDLLTRTGITQGLSVERLGGLVQTASKFDVKTAVDFAKGVQINNISQVQLTAKAGEYATSFVNKLGSGIQTQTANLGTLAGQVGNIQNINDLSSLSGALGGNLTGLASEIGKLSSLPGVGGQLASLAGTVGRIGGAAGQVNGVIGQLSSISGQLGNLSSISGQLGNLNNIASLAKGFTNIAGAVGSAVGLVQGLFGGRGGSIYAGTVRPRGVSSTVNRSTVDASINAILGNAKIPTPTFAPQSSQILTGLAELKSLSGLAAIQQKLSGEIPVISVGLSSSGLTTADDVRLTYTGSDPIVWDRVNRERITLGLPGLADIGIPRPR